MIPINRQFTNGVPNPQAVVLGRMGFKEFLMLFYESRGLCHKRSELTERIGRNEARLKHLKRKYELFCHMNEHEKQTWANAIINAEQVIRDLLKESGIKMPELERELNHFFEEYEHDLFLISPKIEALYQQEMERLQEEIDTIEYSIESDEDDLKKTERFLKENNLI